MLKLLELFDNIIEQGYSIKIQKGRDEGRGEGCADENKPTKLKT